MGCPCSREDVNAKELPKPLEHEPAVLVQQVQQCMQNGHAHQLHRLLRDTDAQPLEFRCGSCGQVFGVPPVYAQVTCPKCNHINAGPSQLPLQSYWQGLTLRAPAVVDASGPAPTGRRRALLVGVNYFGTRAQLKGCINDVHRSYGLLTQRYGFSPAPDSMRVLTDDTVNPQLRPTRENILIGMHWLVENVQPGDVLFFHFSGHGAQQEDPTYREEDGYDETICPVDFQAAGMIVDDDMFDCLVAPLPHGAKLTAVMDCCHSGTGLDLPFTWNYTGWSEDENPCHSAGDVLLLSGCQEEQTSSDCSGSYCRPMGAMTTALCNTLERTPVLTHVQLLEALHRELAAGGFDQIPCLTSSQRFDARTRPFSPCDGIVGNTNPFLGRHFRKKKHPARPNLLQGALGEMLLDSAVGLLGHVLASTVGSHSEHYSQMASLPMNSWGQRVGIEEAHGHELAILLDEQASGDVSEGSAACYEQEETYSNFDGYRDDDGIDGLDFD